MNLQAMYEVQVAKQRLGKELEAIEPISEVETA
jgi:hypothetical protein